MKKFNFWFLLISGIFVLIGSCATDDSSSSSSSSTTSTSTLSAPSDATATLGWHQVAVDWTAVSGASSYTVYWGTSAGISSTSTAITSITDDNYTHTGIDNGTTYYYKVAAVDSSGTGSLSSEVSATPRGVKTVAEACTAVSLTETPSGDWDGMKDKDNVSGSFYFYTNSNGTTSNGCVSDSSFLSNISANIPSGTLGWIKKITITSSTTFTKTDHWFSDSGCTVGTGWFATGYDNVSIGDNITIAGWPQSGTASQLVPYATKFDNYTAEDYCMLAETDAAKSHITTSYGQTVTVGTSHSVSTSSLESSIMVFLDNVSGSTKNWLNYYSYDNSTTPDNWSTTSTNVMYNL